MIARERFLLLFLFLNGCGQPAANVELDVAPPDTAPLTVMKTLNCTTNQLISDNPNQWYSGNSNSFRLEFDGLNAVIKCNLTGYSSYNISSASLTTTGINEQPLEPNVTVTIQPVSSNNIVNPNSVTYNSVSAGVAWQSPRYASSPVETIYLPMNKNSNSYTVNVLSDVTSWAGNARPNNGWYLLTNALYTASSSSVSVTCTPNDANTYCSTTTTCGTQQVSDGCGGTINVQCQNCFSCTSNPIYIPDPNRHTSDNGGAQQLNTSVQDVLKCNLSSASYNPNNINWATLKLFATAESGRADGSINFYRITSGNVVDPNSVSYNYVSSGVPWQSPFYNPNSTAVLSTTPFNPPGQLFTTDVSADIRSWLSGTVNNGWRLLAGGGIYITSSSISVAYGCTPTNPNTFCSAARSCGTQQLSDGCGGTMNVNCPPPCSISCTSNSVNSSSPDQHYLNDGGIFSLSGNSKDEIIQCNLSSLAQYNAAGRTNTNVAATLGFQSGSGSGNGNVILSAILPSNFIDPNSVTYNSVSSGTAWQSPRYNSTPSASIYLPSHASGSGDVTGDVRTWLTGAPNTGWWVSSSGSNHISSFELNVTCTPFTYGQACPVGSCGPVSDGCNGVIVCGTNPSGSYKVLNPYLCTCEGCVCNNEYPCHYATVFGCFDGENYGSTEGCYQSVPDASPPSPDGTGCTCD